MKIPFVVLAMSALLTCLQAQPFEFTVTELNISNGLVIHTADLNGDTFADIIAGSNNPDQIHVFFNDNQGNGIFNVDAGLSYDGPVTPNGIDTGDFNQDGHVDIVVCGRNDSVIIIYFGQADGTFGSRLDLNTTHERVYDVEAADVDNDENLDIVGATLNDVLIVVLKGNGDGSFQARAEYPGYGTPNEICLADFNNDSYLDVAQSHVGGSSWFRYLNDGSGGFPNRERINATASTTFMDAADMDANGYIDLILGSGGRFTENLAIHLNDGSVHTESTPFTPSEGYMRGQCVADFNDDSKFDVLSVFNHGAFISQTDGAGIFTAVDSIADLTDSSPKSVSGADFNNDGKMDAAICHSGKISIFHNETVITAVEQIPPAIDSFLLHQNYPNPFNPSTLIEYELTGKGHVEISVFDLLGRRIRTLVAEEKISGRHHVTWNGLDDTGSQVSSGVYMYSLESGAYTLTRKLLLLH